jgi:hypothetical protein
MYVLGLLKRTLSKACLAIRRVREIRESIKESEGLIPFDDLGTSSSERGRYQPRRGRDERDEHDEKRYQRSG